MKSKLEVLVDDEEFGKGAIDVETGIMLNEYGDAVDYLILTFLNQVKVYLNLFVDVHSVIRNILGEGTAQTEEDAKFLAIEDLNRQAYFTTVN